MLLLSRKVNESVVIGDRLVVTVVGITAAAVEVSIQDGDAAPAKVVLTPDGYCELGLGVRAVVVNVRPPTEDDPWSRARLGFAAPSDVPFSRKEVWDAIHGGKGPGSYRLWRRTKHVNRKVSCRVIVIGSTKHTVIILRGQKTWKSRCNLVQHGPSWR